MQDDVAPKADQRAAPRRRRSTPASSRIEEAPVASLLDPRVIQILTAEHSSLQADRSLAYNEAFTRTGIFLTFLSMSFVALALVAQAVPINRDFLPIAALLLAFDFVVGLTTYGRVVATSHEDYRAVLGMTRIRHGYGEIAPGVLPYFISGTHDDLTGVMVSYGSPPLRGIGAVVNQLLTSAGMSNIIVSMIGGALSFVVALMLGTELPVALGIASLATVVVFLGLGAITVRFYLKVQANQEVIFPTPRK